MTRRRRRMFSNKKRHNRQQLPKVNKTEKTFRTIYSITL